MHDRNIFAQTIVLLLLLQITVLLARVIPASSAPLSVDELRETITILARARDSIIKKSYKTLTSEVSQTTEQQDLHVFISYLDGRIYYYCEQLLDIDGINTLNKTVCPAKQNGGLIANRYMMIPDTSSRTTEERLAELDTSFSDSLGTFDEMLLKEQQQLAASIKKQRANDSRTETAPDEAAGATGNQATPDGMGDSRPPSTTATTADGNQAAGAGTEQQVRIPPTTGNKDLSQSADDIVAKQLKEAAEQETDPEIKTKLWEEYRKYKEGTR